MVRFWQADGVARGNDRRDRPEVPEDILRRLRPLLASLPECVEEAAWVGVRWQVARGSPHGSPDGLHWATVAHVFGGEDQLFRITFRAEPDEVMAFQHLGDPYFRASWGRNVVGILLDDQTDYDELGELLTDSYCVQAPQELAARVPRPG
jgi:hypothetical protein